MFLPPLIIESDKVVARPPTEADSAALFRNLFADEDVMRWLAFPRHRDEAETLAAIQRYRRNWHLGTGFAWVVQGKDNGDISGVIEVQPYMPRVEIGVISASSPAVRRRSAGLHVLRKLVDWIADHPDVHRVHAFCAPEGRAASAMERLGFRLEARLENWEIRPNGGEGPRVGDSLLYAMTRREGALRA